MKLFIHDEWDIDFALLELRTLLQSVPALKAEVNFPNTWESLHEHQLPIRPSFSQPEFQHFKAKK